MKCVLTLIVINFILLKTTGIGIQKLGVVLMVLGKLLLSLSIMLIDNIIVCTHKQRS